jgi:phosphatidylserine/phosphatidylglycerophosphate/cardiolipin synthase-like enzyme
MVDPKPEPASRLVMSVPAELRAAMTAAVPGLLPTYNALLSLFRGAQRFVKVFSPYVDPTFTSLVQAARCAVKVISTAPDARRARGNAVLERCASLRDVIPRYIVERRGGTQIFQMHAKMVLSDLTAAYIGSTNLTDTSLHYNLELGVLTTDRALLQSLDRAFNYLFDRVAVPAQLL